MDGIPIRSVLSFPSFSPKCLFFATIASISDRVRKVARRRHVLVAAKRFISPPSQCPFFFRGCWQPKGAPPRLKSSISRRPTFMRITAKSNALDFFNSVFKTWLSTELIASFRSFGPLSRDSLKGPPWLRIGPARFPSSWPSYVEFHVIGGRDGASGFVVMPPSLSRPHELRHSIARKRPKVKWQVFTQQTAEREDIRELSPSPPCTCSMCVRGARHSEGEDLFRFFFFLLLPLFSSLPGQPG